MTTTISDQRRGGMDSIGARVRYLREARSWTQERLAQEARAAVAGFREAMTWVGDGGALVITPDGPRGPNEVIAAGALQIARRTGAPVFLMGIAAHPATQLETWDKVMFAAPFGKGVVVWDGPYHAPPKLDEAQARAVSMIGIELLAEDVCNHDPAAKPVCQKAGLLELVGDGISVDIDAPDVASPIKSRLFRALGGHSNAKIVLLGDALIG